MTSKLAMVVPCYNEEKRISIDYWWELLESNQEVSWIFVDDGSSDQTSVLLEQFCTGDLRSLIRLDRNIGKGNAILQGYKFALQNLPDVEFFGFIDCDGAFAMEDVNNFLKTAFNRQTNFEVLISSRVALSGRDIQRKSHRHYLGRIIATFLTYKWRNAPYDTQSGLKVFRNTESFRNAILSDFSTKWFSDIELISRIGVNNGGRIEIWEEPLMSWSDVDGSKLKVRNFPSIFRQIYIARRSVRALINAGRTPWI
jgi:dolichyl-phosphate beta-glucosyltransferase